LAGIARNLFDPGRITAGVTFRARRLTSSDLVSTGIAIFASVFLIGSTNCVTVSAWFTELFATIFTVATGVALDLLLAIADVARLAVDASCD
jgi:hypothetical protein